jgi:cell division protease FtsH
VQQRGNKDRKTSWTSGNPWLLFLLGMALLSSFFWMTYYRDPAVVPLKYGELIQILEAARNNPSLSVQKLRVGHTDIRGEIVTVDPASDGSDESRHAQKVGFRALRLGLENDLDLHKLLKATAGPAYQGEEDDSGFKSLMSMVFSIILMVCVLLVIGVLFMRWMSGGGSPMTFGRNRARLYAQSDTSVTFADVAGLDEATAELREVVDFLKTPEKYQALGGRIPKGVLLIGPPGTGKTLLARAVAGEAEVPFFSLSGSDFVEMFVGVGAARVRDLFAQAESRAPVIVFIDELDALGKSRAGNVPGSHDEREQTLNQLLVEMDGFESNRGVILMAATNRPEILDAALLRPGRFDRTVVVDRPDLNGREAILKVHARNVRLGPDVDLRHVARLTPGSAGADLANLVNEAALLAARAGKDAVSMADFNEAIERVAVGLQRKSRIMLAEEKRRVAYHEAGHALVSCSLPNTSPVHKISIIPRGVGVGGYVLSRPEDDRHLVTRSELESQIKVLLGGTLAEEIIFDEISTGATSDLDKASTIARSMVKEFGMSRLGRVYYHERGAQFLSSAFGDGDREYSEHTAREIDEEVRRIIDAATDEVRTILRARRPALEAVARKLIEKEVIEEAELLRLLEEFPPASNGAANGVAVGEDRNGARGDVG